jgi:uncharacterized membrane protein YdjX (TVP38/TMEM64 family)
VKETRLPGSFQYDEKVLPEPMSEKISEFLSRVDKKSMLSMLFLIAFYLVIRQLFSNLLPPTETILNFFQNSGVTGFLLFLLLFLLRGLLFFPPNFTLTLISGVLFGPLLGIAVSFLGTLLCAVFEFGLSRLLGYRAIKKIWRAPLSIPEVTPNFQYVFWMRIMFTVPFDLMNYALGLTQISFKDYFWGTTLGLIPNIILVALLSSSLKQLTVGNTLPFIVLTLCSLYMIYREFRRNRKM